MRIIEQMFYEARPYLYGLIGLYSISHYENKLLAVCGLTLLYCSIIVVNMRLEYRDQMVRTHTSAKKYKD